MTEALLYLIFQIQKAVREGFCFHPRSDGSHCDHWWDCEACHFCGYDNINDGLADCDCETHTALREGIFRALSYLSA